MSGRRSLVGCQRASPLEIIFIAKEDTAFDLVLLAEGNEARGSFARRCGDG